MSAGTNAFGGGGNLGLSSAFSCVADHAYDCASFVICAAASCRTFSRSAVSSARFWAYRDLIAGASGSLCAVYAASRFAWAVGASRGIADWARAMESDAWLSQLEAPLLNSDSRQVALARSEAQ
ncbi:hypothetical protein [Streptomyces niveiscabiei]|uniref:Uncharacterized protein n=1 Tax=Streptomyces niveiscabiei TaxID=164115 RepID=A0ABW9I630_9ACTN